MHRIIIKILIVCLTWINRFLDFLIPHITKARISLKTYIIDVKNFLDKYDEELFWISIALFIFSLLCNVLMYFYLKQL